jgi:hypothetical protein
MNNLNYNPYPELSTQLVAGLNSIISDGGLTTPDELVDAVYSFVQELDCLMILSLMMILSQLN